MAATSPPATASLATAASHPPLLRGWLHAGMTPLAVLGALVLLRTAPSGSLGGRLSVGVFCLSLVGLYAISSTYHVGRWDTRVKQLLGRCDGAMIQVFIAGTFTPIAFHALDGSWRVWSLGVAWAVAIVGAGIAVSPIRAPRWLTTFGYLGMGWLGAVPMIRVMGALPSEGVGLIALGGVMYTIGALVYMRRRPDPLPAWFGFHEVFHLFVIAGSVAHYLAIWRYVLPAT